MGFEALTVGRPIANYGSELAKYLSNLPSAATGRGEKEWVGENSVLAGADVCSGLLVRFPC
jgi:hypothetical protein